MAKISYETCVSRFSIQVQELARMENFYNRLDELYQDSIGKLYDEFNIEIPLRLKQSFLWGEETRDKVSDASEQAATVLNQVRVTPKPYQPKGIAEVKEHVRAMQKAMLQDMTDEFVTCACPSEFL
jgi:hypothetical protein